MNIEIDDYISLDSKDDSYGALDELNSDYVTIVMGGSRNSVKIDTLIQALEAMKARD